MEPLVSPELSGWVSSSGTVPSGGCGMPGGWNPPPGAGPLVVTAEMRAEPDVRVAVVVEREAEGGAAEPAEDHAGEGDRDDAAEAEGAVAPAPLGRLLVGRFGLGGFLLGCLVLGLVVHGDTLRPRSVPVLCASDE